MKKRALIFICFLGACFIAIALVRSKTYGPQYYYTWHNSKESKVSKWNGSGQFIFNGMYRPIEFMALSELNGEKLTDSKFEKTLQNFQCCEHVLLRIFSKDTNSEALAFQIKSEAEYYERIRYLNAEFASHTYLVDGPDTLSCTFSHFERTYKLQPFISLNLIYEKKNKLRGRNLKLVIEPTIFNNVTKFLEFTMDEINQIPKLKI